MARGVSDIYEHIGYWHNRLGRQIDTALERRLVSYEVTPSQWCLMAVLFHQQADTVRDLARVIQMDAGSVTRLADRLVAKGLIKRDSDPADARSVRLSLTRKGSALLPKLAAEVDRNDEACFAVLSNTEIGQYKKLLSKLLRAAGNTVPGNWTGAPLKRTDNE